MAVDWKSVAEDLFFVEDLQINDIADKVNKSCKAVSSYLKTVPAFIAEKQRRKRENSNGRKEYKNNWDKTRRKRTSNVDYGAILKRQHEVDVRVLSSERFF